MKLLPITQQQNNVTLQSPRFQGAVDSTLRYLATNQAIGANSVDVCFMVAPRTANDGIKRGAAAGFETGRRESMGTINDSLIGVYGSIAGSSMAFLIDKKYGTNINTLFTSPETLEILAQNKANQLKNKKTQADYIKSILSSVKAYNPTSKHSDSEGYIKISKKTIDNISKYFDEILTKNTKYKDWINSKSDKSRDALMNIIMEDTGAQSDFIVQSADKKIKSKTNLKSLMNDIFLVSESFNNDKVKASFMEQIKTNSSVRENVFVKKLTSFMKTRAGMGFVMASAVGLSVQPINMYLTKLKTGSDGFVGVEGRTKDNSKGFLGLKTASSVAFFSMILATLGIKPWKVTPKKFMGKMEFTGKMPTINQLKGVYGVTIISRIFSSRDKDELREVLTKDTLGYLSWLVLGDIINRIVAAKADSSVINYKKGTEKSGFWKQMYNASLKTRDEILIEELAKNGIASTKKDGDEVIAKTFKELTNDISKLSPELQKITKKRLRTLNIAQVSGYLFSGLVLGLGIPNLNIYLTNYFDKKRKAEAAKKNIAA